MEPTDARPRNAPPPPPPPPSRPVAPAPFAAPPTTRGREEVARRPDPTMLPMFAWRVGAAVATVASFAAMGWQVVRLLDDQAWSSTIMALTILCAVVAGACVLAWTWFASENARRLVGPVGTVSPPDPARNVAAWLIPFGFVAVSLGVIAILGSGLEVSDDAVSSTPLLVAVVTLLVAIPLTYRPVYRLAGAVRQVGGYSAKLSEWMWVPVVLAVVGGASLVALRFGVVDDDNVAPGNWAPLWVVAVIAIVPCVVVVALAWRAAEAVEEAITVAARRRRGDRSVAGKVKPTRRTSTALRGRIELVPGAELLRLGIVSLIAGLALLSLVGAIVMFMFWLDGNDRSLSPGQQTRAWDAMGALHEAARYVALAVVVLVAIWAFVSVLNVRRSSGTRRNPIVAAAAWPLAGAAIWVIADRLVVDQPVATVILGLALQSLVLFVPIAILERAADAVDARRTPLRISYAFGVVLLVHIQGFGGLSTIEPTVDSEDYLRFAGYLALGALVQLLSTLAITDACRSLARSTQHDADHHNFLVDQRERAAGSTPIREAAR